MKKVKLPLIIMLIFVLLFTPGVNIIKAYNHTPNTVFDNVFELNGEKILPIIFENSNQTVTKSYIIEQCKKAGHTLTNENSLGNIIKTGDKIVTNNQTYTILIYGDVDSNGKVNVFDAQKALQHYVYEGRFTLQGIYAVVANVNNPNDVIDTFDAQRILNFWVGNETNLVLNEPDTKKITPDIPPALEKNTVVEYGTLLLDIKLSKGWTFDNITNTSTVGNVGTKEFAVTYTPEDTDKYDIIHDKVTIIVEKAIPESPVLPTNLTAKAGDLLSTIKLPKGWSFDNMTAMSTVGNVGTKEFAVTYTPEDTKNYKTKSDTVTIVVTEENQKIVNVVEIGNTANCYRYDKSKITTIKSSNNIILTSECKIEFEVSGPANSTSSKVTGEFSKIAGEYDVYFYATKAGEYTITPIISGTNVKNGKIKGTPIKVTVQENYELTDITLDGLVVSKDGKLISENGNEVEAIEVKTGKHIRPEIKFYHIYRDEFEKELARVQLPDADLLNVHITFLGETTKILPLQICNGKTAVSWDNDSGTNSYVPNNILIEAKEDLGAEDITINIEKATENETIELTRTVKVNVTKLKTKDLILGSSSINLYSYSPTYTSLTVKDKTYESAKIGKDMLVRREIQENVYYDYTLFPIKLQDEFGDDLKIKAKDIRIGSTFQNTYGCDYVTFIEDSDNIDVKGYYSITTSQGEKYYVEASGTDTIDFVGIAIKDTTKPVSNITIFYDNLTRRDNKPITVTKIKEGIKGISTEETEHSVIYRYDDNYTEKKIATIRSTNIVDIMDSCELAFEIQGPENSDNSTITKVPVDNAYDLYLYATKAGKYTITPVVTGANVEGGTITGDPIEVTVEENYTLTDITVNGLLVTEDGKLMAENGNEIEAIEVKNNRAIRPEIKFYHIYRDETGKELDRVQVPDEELLKVHITFPEKTTAIMKPQICNGEIAIGWDYESATNRYVPNNILIEGMDLGTENITIKIEDHNNDTNNIIERIMKVNVTKLKAQNLILGNPTLDTPAIELYSSNPTYTSLTVNGKTYESAEIGENIVVKGITKDITYNYTLFPIKLQAEDGYDLKIKAKDIRIGTGYQTRYGYDYVTFVENLDNIDVKGYYLMTTSKGEKYYVEASGTDAIDFIGIAIKDTTKPVSDITIYYDNLTKRESKLLSVNVETAVSYTIYKNEKESNTIKNTIINNSISSAVNNNINSNIIRNNI